MKKLLIVMLFAVAANAATFPIGSPATTNNDDSCDIGLFPAATLLLPYFEVDVTSNQAVAQTTLFTVTNTSPYPQIARVTMWTDLGYPVLDFNLFLTGYDVQAINLYDILVRRVIAPPNGTASDVEPGDRSLPNNANPNFAPSAATDCVILPGQFPASIGDAVLSALTRGITTACGNARIGETHAHAIGYLTIDVVNTCGVSLPDDAAYYSEMLYDNVLTGDYQIINPNPATGNYASGNPMVHIRAIPEGGAAGSTTVATNLPYTFYDRLTPRAAPAIDRRQPLPATFGARFIQGGPGAFNTAFQIWREGITGPHATCSEYANNDTTQMRLTDVVRFDEHENPSVYSGCINCLQAVITLPATSSTLSSSSIYPVALGTDTGGWMYLNLNNAGSSAYSTARHSQNWVIVSMSAEGRYSVAFDATMLANGCTAAPAAGAPIGPGPTAGP